MKKNKVDDRLAERTKKKSSYPDFTDWNQYQALYRDPVYTKLLLLQLEKQYKKLYKNWEDFWDMVTDLDPQYCFICGKYILPKMRADKERIKRPYRNGDVVHAYCFQKEGTVERMTGKLNPESELICRLDLGWSVMGSVCRDRVLNRPVEVMQHLIDKHHWKLVPELAFNELEKVHDDVQGILRVYGKKVKADNLIWFHDNQINFEEFRNNQFLRPTGKPFPQKRSDY